MREGNFLIGINNGSTTTSVWYKRLKPTGGNEKEIKKNSYHQDDVTVNFIELEFDLYKKSGNDTGPVCITDFAVIDPCNSVVIKSKGSKKTKVLIKYTQQIKPKLIGPDTPDNVNVGVKE